MSTFTPPSLRQQLTAILLALACALGFLRSAVSPANALLPYPPEFLQPSRQEAQASGTPSLAETYRGNLAMGDKFNQSLAWDRIIRDRFRRGELPLWTRDIAGGVPFGPQMGQAYHPLNLLLLAIPAAGIYGIWYLIHMVLMGFFAYRFMRRIQIGHPAALFGMVAIIVGFWLQARVHHNVMLSAALPVFAMLSCTHHILVHRGAGGHMAMLAASTGLSWICGFAPASLMCTYLVSAYALLLIRQCPNGQRLAALTRFGTAVVLGLLLASVHLLPVLQAAEVTSRMPATLPLLADRALELPHLATTVWPTLFAWPADHFYLPDGSTHFTWASIAGLSKQLHDAAFNFPETAFYIGLAPLCLTFTGLRHRGSWFFATAGAVGLAMAMGWLLPASQFLPGAHSGDVKRFLLLFGICTPIVAAMGLQRILAGQRARLPLLLLGIVLVHSTEFGLLHLAPVATLQDFYGLLCEHRQGQEPGVFAEWLRLRGHPDEGLVNQQRLLHGFWVAAVAALLAIVALWRIGRHTAPLLIVMTAAELLYLGNGTIVPVPTERLTTPPAILRPVLDATLDNGMDNGVRPRLQRLMPPLDHDRLGTPVFANLASFWGVEDLATYNPLPKRRMEEFFLALEPDRPTDEKISVVLGGSGVDSLRDKASLSHPLADLIGIEWILTPSPVDLPGLTDRTPTGLQATCRLYHRATCLPRATFVTSIEILEDRAERLRRLADRSRDPRVVVILEDPAAETPRAPTRATPESSVTITHHADQEVRIDVRAGTGGYLRLADPYDKGWTAEVDGTPAKIYVADHYLRAVYVGAGAHQVVFRYDGTAVWVPQALSLLALLMIMLLAVVRPFAGRRRPTTAASPD